MKNPKTKYFTYVAMLAAISGVLMSLEISVPLMPVFYKIDFSDVPTMIAVFLLGPTAGFIVEIIKTLIKIATVGTNTMYVGEFASLISSFFFVYPLGLIFKKGGKTLKAAMIGLGSIVIIKTIAACFINLFISLPLYAKAMGIELDALVQTVGAANPAITNLTSFIVLATIPFNLIKVGLNSIIAYYLYKTFILKHVKGVDNG